jgi:hypothetical protein
MSPKMKLILYNRYRTKLEAKAHASHMRTLHRWKHVQVKKIKRKTPRGAIIVWGVYTDEDNVKA